MVAALLGLMLVASVPASTATVATGSLIPNALSLSTVPSKLPADNNTYPAVVVSVVDSNGRPTVAKSDIQVSLTSSQESVGTISAEVDIPAGGTYVIANFTTTHTAGATTITATTTGLKTASATVTTVVAVGYPTHLVMTAIPSTVPARSANVGNLILELEDDSGLPAKAIADVPISLYSSNTNVVNLTAPAAVMKQGAYLDEVNYTSGFVPGTATITASASGFASGQATISVLGSPPLALKLLAQPSTMPACTGNVTSCTGRLVVALTDLDGNPTRATRNIEVQIRSADLAIVNASETTTIEEGNISATATFTVAVDNVPTPPGLDQVTITASSPGLQSAFASINIQDPVLISRPFCTSQASPICQLNILAGPSPVLADHRSYSSVVVSLWATSPGGEAGPAINATGATEVTLTSSVTGVGNFTRISFSIPPGQNWASVTFTSTFQVGQTMLTASAQNILPVQTALATYGPIPAQVVLSPISAQLPADGAQHTALELALEDAFGSPAVAPFDVPVSLSSSSNDIISVSNAVIPSGQTYAVLNVTAGILQGHANVTALVSSFTSGYVSSSVELSTVIPAPSALVAVAPDANNVMLTAGTGNAPPPMAIQLTDSGLNPARARAPMNITITSSNSTVIPTVQNAIIQIGQDYTTIPLSARVAGQTTLTLSSPGLKVASLPMTFLAYPSVETLTGGPAKIFTNQSSILVATVSLDGQPEAGAPVSWSAPSGGFIIATSHTTNSTTISATSFVAAQTSTSTRKSTTTTALATLPIANDTTDKTGTSTAIFHPAKIGTVVVTAVVSPQGLPTKTLNFTVTVTAAPPPPVVKHKATLVQQLTTFPLMLVPVGGAGGAVVLVLLVRRRGGSKGGGEEEFDNTFE